MFPQDKPVYQLLADCFLDDDTLHREGEQIIYPGTPNENMAPLNKVAEERMAAYQAHLDECAAEKAALMGRPFRGRLADWQDTVAQVREDAAVLAKRTMPTVPKEATPLTGVAGNTLQARREKAEASGVKVAGTADRPSGRPDAQPIHRERGLTQSPPIGGR